MAELNCVVGMDPSFVVAPIGLSVDKKSITILMEELRSLHAFLHESEADISMPDRLTLARRLAEAMRYVHDHYAPG